ncbi:MAG TPA: twin-arginine translocation signal domain-containing protein [Tepidisphaeraceae bacterium]|nr:twin-arginine translocation signal domain-containing protein [Tepidisphaeraceae bacterium]
MNRRDFLKTASIVAATALLDRKSVLAQTEQAMPLSKKYVTCFYQLSKKAVATLSAPNSLPNGDKFEHIFTSSFPGTTAHKGAADMVHAAGPSFKFGLCIDLHKYKTWLTDSEETVKRWCQEFRQTCFDSGADYVSFNEFPPPAPQRPDMHARVAMILRFLHDPGDGKKLPGVFYFTEEGVEPYRWKGGDSPDLWKAIDETSALVVAEHYHKPDFIYNHPTPEKYADHLSVMTEYLEAKHQLAIDSILRDKWAVLHSSYYGKWDSGWQGVLADKYTEDDVRKYVQFCIDSTHACKYGANRLSFGPLETRDFDDRIVAILAELLGKDARAWATK